MTNYSKTRCNTSNGIKIVVPVVLTVSFNLVRSELRSILNFALAVFFVALVFEAVTTCSAEQTDTKVFETKLDIDFEQTSVLFSIKFA